ncbi:hypothetical protein O0L34_g4654 [Tuta absoluta]|nr:hypothetical protein O0L34_g4654 [Tuta absoluta]
MNKEAIVVAVTNANPRNTDIALDFVLEHFHEIQPRVQAVSGTTNILITFARWLNSEQHRDKMNVFVARYGAIMTAGELATVAEIRANIEASINWTNEHLATVEAWLQANYGGAEPDAGCAITSNILVILSALCAYLYR